MSEMTARRMIRVTLGLGGLGGLPREPDRDPDLPCPSRAFEHGAPAGDCDTDGHYMCAECANCRPGALEERYEP